MPFIQPYPHNNYDLYNKFKQDMPLRRNGNIDAVGQRLVGGQQQFGQQQPVANVNTSGNAQLRPGYTPPDMNVVYKPPMSDQIGARILGIGPGAITPLDEKELTLKGEAIDATRDKNIAANQLGNDKLAVAKDRADVYRFKAENPGLKFQTNKLSGELEAIDPITGEVTGLGKHQLGEKELLDLNQNNKAALIDRNIKGRESLADLQARHAKELQDARLAQAAAGTTTTTSVTDAAGKPAGTRTTSTKSNVAPKKDDIKTFPNGKKGKWDGNGWVAVP